MIRAVSFADWWLYKTASVNGRGRLEIWAYRRGWLDMWPGRKEAIEYLIAHQQEIEDWRNGGWEDEHIRRIVREEIRKHESVKLL